MKILFVTLTTAFLVFAAASNAQQAPVQTPQQNAEIPELKLVQFSLAMKAIGDVGAKYEEDFESAETTEEAQKIQQQAQSEMVEAVETAGLSTEEYNLIAQRAQEDETLRRRILAITQAESE